MPVENSWEGGQNPFFKNEKQKVLLVIVVAQSPGRMSQRPVNAA